MPPASKHHFLALAAACGSWHSVLWCLLALRVSKSTPIPSWPCCWRCRKPFLHKVLPFQIKNPAQSPARGAGSLSAPSSPEFKRGLKECRAFPAPITLNYSDTAMHPPAGSRACFPPSLPPVSTLHISAPVHSVSFRQCPACPVCQLRFECSAALLCPRTRDGEWDKGSQNSQCWSQAGSLEKAWGKETIFSLLSTHLAQRGKEDPISCG